MPREPVGVTLAVPALVVVADDPEPAALEERHAAEHLLAEDGVGLEEAPLRLGQRRRLVEDRSGIPILPTSWRRKPYSMLGSSNEPGLDRPGQLHRVALHPVRVGVRAQVLRLERRREGADGLAVGRLDEGALALLELEQPAEVLRVADQLLLGLAVSGKWKGPS